MVFSDTIHAMLVTHDKYRQFTSKKIVDARISSQVLICISADSREEVDSMVGKAGAAGGVITWVCLTDQIDHTPVRATVGETVVGVMTAQYRGGG